MPEAQILALLGLLEAIIDPVEQALRTAPIDDEPETKHEIRAVAEAGDWFRRNDGKGMHISWRGYASARTGVRELGRSEALMEGMASLHKALLRRRAPDNHQLHDRGPRQAARRYLIYLTPFVKRSTENDQR